MKSYQDINAQTIDKWVEEGWEWGNPISHDEFESAKKGSWNVKLTPVRFVPHEWFVDVKGKRILGLASGGDSKCRYSQLLAQSVRFSTIPKNRLNPSESLRTEKVMR